MTNEEGHRALWTWLAKDPYRMKFGWPGWHDYPKVVSCCHCFACLEATMRQIFLGKKCVHCPIKWGSENNVDCLDNQSEFRKWVNCEFEMRGKYARIIAEKEWRPAP